MQFLSPESQTLQRVVRDRPARRAGASRFEPAEFVVVGHRDWETASKPERPEMSTILTSGERESSGDGRGQRSAALRSLSPTSVTAIIPALRRKASAFDFRSEPATEAWRSQIASWQHRQCIRGDSYAGEIEVLQSRYPFSPAELDGGDSSAAPVGKTSCRRFDPVDRPACRKPYRKAGGPPV